MTGSRKFVKGKFKVRVPGLDTYPADGIIQGMKDKVIMARCARCKHDFDRETFFLEKEGIRVFTNLCRSCQAIPEQVIAEHRRLRNKARKFGLTIQQYLQLRSEAEEKCQICGDDIPDSQANIDHDHASGKVRGLLCTFCNAGLGYFLDSPNRMLSAVKYLRDRGYADDHNSRTANWNARFDDEPRGTLKR